jgi:hypothetical protein
MTAYTSPGMVPVTPELLAEAEADARAIYGVPEDFEGTAHDWMAQRIAASIDAIENLYVIAAMEDDGHAVSFRLGCNCDRCLDRRRYEASV